MNRFAISRPLLPVALVALAAATAVLPAAATAATKSVVKEGTVASLGKTVLTDNAGRTLYSLSVEKHGKFICTGSCLADWKPLLVPAGTKPTGPVRLATVKRPDGRIQVTYKGRPLYRFAGDSKPGQANGEGVKDVGTWHAAAIGPASSSEPPGQEPSPPPYPYPSPY